MHFPAHTPPDQVEVLVVGAGSATLVRAGAMGHSPRTVEHFRRWGVLQSIRDEWTFPPEWNKGIRLITSLVGHELVPSERPDFAGRRDLNPTDSGRPGERSGDEVAHGVATVSSGE